MAQVTITLNGRTYRLQCGEGEEPRLIELADVVRGKLQTLVSEFGQAGDDRLLLMAALLIADELLETRARLASVTGPIYQPEAQIHQPDAVAAATPSPRRAGIHQEPYSQAPPMPPSLAPVAGYPPATTPPATTGQPAQHQPPPAPLQVPPRAARPVRTAG